jgi:hypothetical protein
VTLRTRVATVITSALLLAGVGAGVQANAAPAKAPSHIGSENNGCVLIVPMNLGVCIPRL